MNGCLNGVVLRHVDSAQAAALLPMALEEVIQAEQILRKMETALETAGSEDATVLRLRSARCCAAHGLLSSAHDNVHTLLMAANRDQYGERFWSDVEVAEDDMKEEGLYTKR